MNSSSLEFTRKVIGIKDKRIANHKPNDFRHPFINKNNPDLIRITDAIGHYFQRFVAKP
jgi:hypothetical protein